MRNFGEGVRLSDKTGFDKTTTHLFLDYASPRKIISSYGSSQQVAASVARAAQASSAAACFGLRGGRGRRGFGLAPAPSPRAFVGAVAVRAAAPFLGARQGTER